MLLRYSVLAMAMVIASPAVAVDPEALQARVDKLEQRLNSSTLLEMLDRIELLQQEVSHLRGKVEEQSHEIEGLKERQRELYLDIDRRISGIERDSMAGMAPATGEMVVSKPGSSSAPSTQAPALATPPLSAAKPQGKADQNQVPAVADRPTTEVSAPKPVETPKPQPSKPTMQRTSSEERAAYQQAFDQLKALKYEQAITAFTQFLNNYPDGRYAHIAQYWLGEANYARRDYQAAIDAYQGLRQRFPRSPKVVEALLKIGYSYYELGQKGQARQVMETLRSQYPGTTEAGQAQNLLRRIRSEQG